MSVKELLAKGLPYPVKQFLKYAYGTIPPSIRYGKVFWETYNFLQESQWLSIEKLEEYQMRQLNKLLHHAYENVPYYRKVFDDRKIKPKEIQNVNDLRKLPCLDKDTFKLHFNEIIARNIKLRHMPMSSTSGTTGKPLQFYRDRLESVREWAFVCHQWSRVGYKPGEARVEMRGPIIRGRNPVDYDPINRVLRLSPRTDGKGVAQYYLERMKSFRAKFLHGYPSAIASFAHMVRKYGLVVPFKLKAVLFASEAVYDWEREIVQEVFKCRVFDFYGLTEHVAIAAECEHSHFYHFVPQYGVVEIDPDTHEIIATGFLNYVNPFIRYRTTDIASSSVLSKCKYCGREYFPIIEKVQGRLEDFIITPKGSLISPAVITHPFKNLKSIKDTQLIQESPERIILRVVIYDKGFSHGSKAELQQLCQDLHGILGDDIQIKAEVVKEIERLKSGKFKWIQSLVSKGLLEKGIENY